MNRNDVGLWSQSANHIKRKVTPNFSHEKTRRIRSVPGVFLDDLTIINDLLEFFKCNASLVHSLLGMQGNFIETIFDERPYLR